MSILYTFVKPKPNKTLINFLSPVNQYLCLQGLPVLRDIPILNKIIGFRGICQVPYLEYSQSEFDQLKSICCSGKATFFAPNHPEFFTDWMIDKFILSDVSPMAASWATSGVVNGLGKIMQRFWLANNLIAQIPGNSKPSRTYSIEWAMQGKGVLLHPEGSVGWHSNYIAPLFPGALDMANEALKIAHENNQPEFEVYVVPLIWKLVFVGNVSKGLLKESHYVERCLKITDMSDDLPLPDRIFHIFNTLLQRDEQKWALPSDTNQHYRDRQLSLLTFLKQKLTELIGYVCDCCDETEEIKTKIMISAAKRYLRETNQTSDAESKIINDLIATITCHQSLGSYAFRSPMITQEELADHIKRLRRDYCKGRLRDTMNAFVPQAAGSRTAFIRVPEPFAVHENPDENDPEKLRQRMQETLDSLNAELDQAGRFIKFPNPFYTRATLKCVI